MYKSREFDLVNIDEYNKYDTDLAFHALRLPTKDISKPSWYIFRSTKNFTLEPGKTILVPSGIKAYMENDEVLVCAPICDARLEYGIQFVNVSSILDEHYYCNSNEQHIIFELANNGDNPWEVKSGDTIVQGIFLPQL